MEAAVKGGRGRSARAFHSSSPRSIAGLHVVALDGEGLGWSARPSSSTPLKDPPGLMHLDSLPDFLEMHSLGRAGGSRGAGWGEGEGRARPGIPRPFQDSSTSLLPMGEVLQESWKLEPLGIIW